MHEQHLLALLPPAGSAHWDEEVLFSRRLRDALANLNGAFLMLAAELHSQRPGMPALGLPAHVVTGLSRVEGAARTVGLPIALYDLRFRDDRFWRSEAANCRFVLDGQGGVPVDARILRLARASVTLAWHLVQSEPRAARLALGLEPATQEVLAGVPVGGLDALARRVSGSLCARFCTRERFWALVTSVLRFGPEAGGLGPLSLLGLQLQGADSARAQHLHRRARRTTQA